MGPLFLAKTSIIDVDTQSVYQWATQNPVGRMVTAGIGILLVLIALYFTFRSMRWAAARWKALMAIAVLLAAAAYGSIYVFHLGPIGWAVAGLVAFGMLIGFSLFLTHTQR